MRFRLLPTDRLRYVQDICPRPGFKTYHGYAWQGLATGAHATVETHANGYSLSVLKSRFISWRRTWTRDLVPPEFSSDSLITVNEWVPLVDGPKTPGFVALGEGQFDAITFVTPDFSKAWSSQARRHLATAKKTPGLSFEFGVPTDYEAMLPQSQIPKNYHDVFVTLVRRHVEAHANDVEVLVAKLNGEAVACFISAYCSEASESIYLAGCFTPAGAHVQAMTGLIAWWFERCLALGIKQANFGSMLGPKPWPFSDWIGYSNFKTHFNIHRVWWPAGRWKITVGRRRK